MVVDRDDVESHGAVRESRSFGDKQRRGSNELALLVNINGLFRGRYEVARAITNLDENKARVVQHDEVYFAEATAEISANRDKALTPQRVKSESLGIQAYNSRVSSNHDASSAASGNSGSGSLLMS